MSFCTHLHLVSCAAVALAVSACISVPIPPALPPVQLSQTVQAPRPGLTARLNCVQDGIRFEVSCEQALGELKQLLAESHWFARAGESEPEPDLVLTVHAPVRRPYWSTPAHNPALLLLSPVIPLWWHEPFGQRIDATLVETGESVHLDTTGDGTIILWSLAGVFNAAPNRAFVAQPQRELDLIHHQLLALVSP